MDRDNTLAIAVAIFNFLQKFDLDKPIGSLTFSDIVAIVSASEACR